MNLGDALSREERVMLRKVRQSRKARKRAAMRKWEAARQARLEREAQEVRAGFEVPKREVPEMRGRGWHKERSERPIDIYDLFEDVDWGDGSVSPDQELRRAALDYKGRP